MANENWEEISEWEIEEDIELAQRITVHAVHTIDDDEEYQLVQAYKHPTYAAAAKWGGRKLSSSKDEASKSNKTPSEVKKKSTTSSDEETSKSKKTSSAKKKVLKDEKDEDDSFKDIILKGDHDVDYDTSDFTSAPLDTKNRKEARRTNSKLHKVQSHKLMSTLISNTELELNQDLVKGDTNRDPEFKRYKLLKKSMALNKKYTEKSKNDRKGLDKLRVEVW